MDWNKRNVILFFLFLTVLFTLQAYADYIFTKDKKKIEVREFEIRENTIIITFPNELHTQLPFDQIDWELTCQFNSSLARLINGQCKHNSAKKNEGEKASCDQQERSCSGGMTTAGPDPSGGYVYYTAHISSFQNTSPIIDGKLDEPIYQELKPIVEFIQTAPNEGEPEIEETEAYIFYGNENIYFSFKCYDSQPDKIQAIVENRDYLRSSDRIGFMIDTFHDKRTGYMFVVNAKGIQADATCLESRGRHGPSSRDYNWNGVWYSATSRFEKGWILEIAIPFKTIRYPNKPVQTWGLNLGRVNPRTHEDTWWYPIQRYDRSGQPSKCGDLRGLKDLPKFRHIDFLPFTTVRQEKSSEYKNRGFYNGGVDLKYSITPNLVANLTLSPDFSQTEVDEENVRLSRWELFYPEKREFFVEGSNIFQTPLSLFFSRRIGAQLPDNSEHRIIFGSKVTGKLGNNQIGIIETVTGDATYFEEGESYALEGANFFVFRMQRDILRKSTIGFITVNRDQKEDEYDFHSQRAHGVDVNLAFGNHIKINSQLAFSFNPGDNKNLRDNLAYLGSFNYDSNLFSFNFMRRDIGEEFEISQIGYYPEVDRIGNEFNFRFKPFINRWGIRQLTFSAELDNYDNHQGGLERSRWEFGISQQWKNFWYTGMQVSSEKEFYYIFCDGEELEEKTIYRLPKRFTFYLRIPQSSAVSGGARVSMGDYIDYDDYFVGKNRSYSISLTAKIGAKLRVGGRINYIQEYFSSGELDEVRGLYLFRVSYNFSSKLRSRFLSQYNLQYMQLTTDALLSYELTSRSGIHFGIRDRSNLGVIDDPEPEDTRVFFKLSYLISF